MRTAVIIATFVTTLVFHAAVVRAAEPPATVKVGDAEVMRLGSGVRVKWFFSQYRLTLYAHTSDDERKAAKGKSADQLARELLAIDTGRPLALRLEIVNESGISVSRMRSSMDEGFAQSLKHLRWPEGTDAAEVRRQTTQLTALFAQFSGVFTERDARYGEVFYITYDPATGSTAWRKGAHDKARTVRDNAPFMAAMFGIWLGEPPFTGDALKRKLLGRE
ncbi:MAG: hypothetical protein GC159_17590 [Phycisphaera sp.]|nr:hypothetical protein [Phycisphaera sp.]